MVHLSHNRESWTIAARDRCTAFSKFVFQNATWTEEQFEKAIKAIENQNMGLNAGAKHFGVPKVTLLRKNLLQEKIEKSSV